MDDKDIQEDILQKQQYLREEIMNKSYDIDEFSEFMSHYKENGLELINWTFDELKEAVKNYKDRNQKNTKEEEEEEKIIEKGVENIRKSYILNQVEYPNLDLNNNLNNTNTNNNININYDYNVINYKNIKNSNIYNNNNDYNNNTNKNIIQTIQNNLNQNNININEEFENNKKPENQTNINAQQKESEFEIIDETHIDNLENIKEKIPCVKQTVNSLTNLNNLQVYLES